MARLRPLAALAAVAVAGACSDTPVAPPAPSLAAAPAADRYIVLFTGDVTDVPGRARAIAAANGSVPDFVYEYAVKGFAAVLPDRAADALRADPSVLLVEKDQPVYAVGPGGGKTVSAEGQVLPWGIDRVDADVSSTLAGNGSGAVSNVNVYIIDTGIDVGHADLNVVEHVNFANGTNSDCNGHGTHVAGTVAAKDNAQDVVGVAPGAPLHGVKVLGCSGSGSTSGVIKGVDWVAAHAVRPAVANMSLGGGASTALDNAVRSAVGTGVFFAVAAGNDGANACNSSPARAGAGTSNGIATTAATDANDLEASWSNYGSCVDLWAPGVGILSTRKGGGTTTMSGTSMATPHVTGAAALYLSSHTSASPSSVEQALTQAAATTGTKSKDGRAIKRLYVGTF